MSLALQVPENVAAPALSSGPNLQLPKTIALTTDTASTGELYNQARQAVVAHHIGAIVCAPLKTSWHARLLVDARLVDDLPLQARDPWQIAPIISQ